MTPFALLCDLAGLSQREASELLAVSPSSIDKMGRGVRATPPGLIGELRALIAMQERTVREVMTIIAEKRLDEIELGYPADDHEARSLGWPCVGAWGAMAARVIAEANVPAILTPL